MTTLYIVLLLIITLSFAANSIITLRAISQRSNTEEGNALRISEMEYFMNDLLDRVRELEQDDNEVVDLSPYIEESIDGTR